MKLKQLPAVMAAFLGAACLDAGAANLGLDAACALNGTDRGMVATPDGMRRRCDLPPNILSPYSDPIVSLPAAVSGTPVLWTMRGTVLVGNGHLAGMSPTTASRTILQIQAGARLAGAWAASLVITRGARILANGTPTNPIVFSSFDNNYTGRGEWGGLILSSWDNVNQCNAGGECEMEGFQFDRPYYGGYVDETSTPGWDRMSSGSVRYVAIAEAGYDVLHDIGWGEPFEVNSGDEINGLTLYGVSRETSISNVHIHNSDDDGIQFFGGDVDVDNLWITCAADDSVDWEFGFHGSINNAYILQSNGSDHAFELSNNKYNWVATPLADAGVSGVTLAFVSPAPDVDQPFRLKEGTGGTFTNVEIGTNYTASCTRIGDVNQLSPSDFNNIEYSCYDPLSLLPPSSPASGFHANTFWADYPGNCN